MLSSKYTSYGWRTCSLCGEDKFLHHFYRPTHSTCSDCSDASTEQWIRNYGEIPHRSPSNRHNGFTGRQWKELRAKYGNVCLACGTPEIDEYPLTPDHVVPLCKGGGGGIDNIQPLCWSCNVKKSRRDTDYRLLVSSAANGRKGGRPKKVPGSGGVK